MNTLFISLLSILALWALIDIYAMFRFRKSNKVDKTAIIGTWLALKWMFASRADEIADVFPWVGQDLSEVLNVKEDDGDVS